MPAREESGARELGIREQHASGEAGKGRSRAMRLMIICDHDRRADCLCYDIIFVIFDRKDDPKGGSVRPVSIDQLTQRVSAVLDILGLELAVNHCAPRRCG